MIGQTLWSMPREEYEARFGLTVTDEPLDFPLLTDAINQPAIGGPSIDQAIGRAESEEIDYFAITRCFG